MRDLSLRAPFSPQPMLRRLILLAVLAALAAPAHAGAQGPPTAVAPLAGTGASTSFLGITTENLATQFFDTSPTKLRTPRRITGLAPGDRILTVTYGYALGRTGRLYRLSNVGGLAPSVAPTPVQLSLLGQNFSLVALPTGVRVLSDSGLDVLADPTTGQVVPGTGFRLADGTPVAGVWSLLSDGRMSGLAPRRGTLLTETAPGSGIVDEVRLGPSSRSPYDTAEFRTPISWVVPRDQPVGFLLTRVPQISRVQSMLVQVSLRTGRTVPRLAPFFRRGIQTMLPVGGTVPASADDASAPKLSNIEVPRRISLRDLRVNYRVKVGARCSEGCILFAASAVGGRSNISRSVARDTPGKLRIALYGVRGRAYQLMKRRVGRTAIIRLRVSDFAGNTTIVDRPFLLTR